MTKFLTSKDDILKSEDSKPIELDVPEWGGKILIGAVSGENREKWEKEFVKKPQPPTVRAMLISFAVVDHAGKLIFTEKDIEALNKKNWRALDRVYDAVIAYNVIGQANVEAEAKN